MGATVTTIRRVDNPTTAVTYQAHFNLEGKLAPLLPKAIVKVAASLDKNVTLTSFHGETSLGPLDLRSTGLVSDSTLLISTRNNSIINRTKVPLQQPISMAEALRPVLGRQMVIKKGATMSTPVLDPLTGISKGTLTIEVGEQEIISINGNETQAFRVVSSIGEIKTIMWVDADGNTLRRQLLGNLFMERTTKEEALRQAPSLETLAEPEALDVADFADVPLQGRVEAQEQKSSGLGLIQGLLR